MTSILMTAQKPPWPGYKRSPTVGSSCRLFFSESANGEQNTLEQGVRIGGTTRNVDIDGDDLVHSAEAGVILAEDPATAAAGSHGDNDAWSRGGLVGFAQGKFHVPRNR